MMEKIEMLKKILMTKKIEIIKKIKVIKKTVMLKKAEMMKKNEVIKEIVSEEKIGIKKKAEIAREKVEKKTLRILKKTSRIFKMTISKKIFIGVLLSFILLGTFNYSIEIEAAKNQAYDRMLSEENVTADLANDFYQNYTDIEDTDFIDKVKTKGKMYQVMDSNMYPVGGLSYYSPSEKIEPILFIGDNQSSDNYRILLKNLDSSVLRDFENWLDGKNIYRDRMTVLFGFKEGLEKDLNSENGVVDIDVNDLEWLEIDSYVMISENQGNCYTSGLNDYKSPSVVLNYMNYYGYPHVLQLDKVVETCITNAQSTYNQSIMTERNYSFAVSDDKQYVLGRLDMSWFEKDNSLYFYDIYPLVSKDAKPDERGAVEQKDIKGYVMKYSVEPEVVDYIETTMAQSKTPVYFVSFILSLLISWFLSKMLTIRIKYMNKATLQITNNDFDVYLNEETQDELGELSGNINVMTEHLKENIGKLTEEIAHVKKLESVRKEFIANFTHEMKTPLGIINGYIELMNEVKDDEKKKQYLAAINKETDRINELITSMLNLTRLESDTVELHIHEVDIEDMLTSTIDSFTSLLEKKNLQVHIEGESPLIQADPFELQIVIKNFLSNAIKHTPDFGHIYIHIQENQVSIENEGTHLTELQKEKIWDTYVSGDRDGTGLGLAICKSILHLHGFKYNVDNTDKGVCFSFETRKEEN